MATYTLDDGTPLLFFDYKTDSFVLHIPNPPPGESPTDIELAMMSFVDTLEGNPDALEKIASSYMERLQARSTGGALH